MGTAVCTVIAPREAPKKRTWTAIAPMILGIACLVWVLRDFNRAELFRQLALMNWWWLAGAIACDILSYVSQGVRWSLLLAPVGRLTVLRSTQAVYAGLFANEMLPLRVGEIVRGVLAAKWTGQRVARVVPSMLLERFIDGLWLAAGIVLTAKFVSLPPDLARMTQVLYWAVGLAAVVFVALLVWTPAAGIPKGFMGYPAHVARAFKTMAGSRNTAAAFGASSLLLLLQALSFWMMMRACGIEVSVWTGSAALLILRLGTMVPGAPANVGTYQFFCVLALTLFGIERTVATCFSVIVFVALTLPLWILGLAAVSASGTTLAALRNAAVEVKNGTIQS